MGSYQNISRSIPQGSALRLSLFLIYIFKNVKIIKYADATSVVITEMSDRLLVGKLINNKKTTAGLFRNFLAGMLMLAVLVSNFRTLKSSWITVSTRGWLGSHMYANTELMLFSV